MATDPDAFFKTVQGAAILKHGILRRYLAVFAAKLGSTSKGNKVVYLDAYAGPGVYDDGKPGSPALATATAEQLSKNRSLVGIYVEKKPDNLEKLREFLDATDHEHHVLEGDIREKLDEALEIIGQAPLLAFFDPFGLTVPMDQLKRLFERPKKEGSWYPPPTEIIINVSYPGIARQCGGIRAKHTTTAHKKAQKTIVEKCDATLGGDWWHPIAEKEVRDSDWVEQIAVGYAKRLHTALGVGWYRVPISDRISGPVVYELLLATKYPREGNWHFHEQVSLANQDYRAFLTSQAPPKQQALELEELEWVAAIKKALTDLLAAGEFEIADKSLKVYGPTIGFARSLHVRKAVKELYKEGITDCTGVGDVHTFKITRGPGVPRKPEKKTKK